MRGNDAASSSSACGSRTAKGQCCRQQNHPSWLSTHHQSPHIMRSLLTSSIERLPSSGTPTRTRTTPTLPKSLKNVHKLTRSSRIPRSAKYTTTTVSNFCSEAVVHLLLKAPGARGTRLPVEVACPRASTLAVWVAAAEEAAPFTSKRMEVRPADLAPTARTGSSRNLCATVEWAWAAACPV